MGNTTAPGTPALDLLLTSNGERVTSHEAWRQLRRPELLRTYGTEVFGTTPQRCQADLRFVVREEVRGALGGLATRLRVGILFEGTETGRQMELLVHLPNMVEGPVPVFLGLNFDGNFATTHEPDLPVPNHYVMGLLVTVPDHRARSEQRGHNAAHWPYEAILRRGYGVATACYGEVEPDLPGQWWHGPRVLAPPVGESEWGAIGGWAWALSRALDYLVTLPRVDAGRVAVVGFSRLGKSALWAAAQDERFAAVVSQNSGKGGVALFDRGRGDTIADLVSAFGHWFASRFARYAENENQLPVNAHALASLLAPRPLLILSAKGDPWSDPEGEFLGGMGADPVYRLHGVEGLAAREWPGVGKLVNSRIGYYLRAGAHDVTEEDWEATLQWAEIHLRL